MVGIPLVATVVDGTLFAQAPICLPVALSCAAGSTPLCLTISCECSCVVKWKIAPTLDKIPSAEGFAGGTILVCHASRCSPNYGANSYGRLDDAPGLPSMLSTQPQFLFIQREVILSVRGVWVGQSLFPS